ncbi:MAG: cell envelope biogenesis protein OmpA [Rhodospirillales bacterium]|nr:cell envelope biogenesis protein OmpA [Rhodospirillales bacterium]MBN8907774.1 cell envelope biogenesis protein OmpA [Rhodospirillales bacterium]
MRHLLLPAALGLGLAVSLGGCTDPYDPGQRAVGGGLLGAAGGAAIGGLAGGGTGAAIGALGGGALGAVGGAATTPQRPAPTYYSAPPSYPAPPPPGYRAY